MEISSILEQARKSTARAVNTIMTAAYWEVGKRIVTVEQSGKLRAEYGEALLVKLSEDLTAKFGKGFSVDNLENMRLFYQASPHIVISETVSRKSSNQKSETLSRILELKELAEKFPLSWSHYVMLVRRAKSRDALVFYHGEALRGGWSVRQLDRQMSSLFFERALMSKNKTKALAKGSKGKKADEVSAEEEIKNPFVLEFLNLKDEYSESDLEEALIQHLETFLLELGGDFAFVARQKRLRIGSEWFRVDLVFFHRGLRCLVLIDLKLKKFTHADAGQMHMYLNYAKEHWTKRDENPPVGLILCAEKDESVAKYALDGLPNKVLASEYKTKLPQEKLLIRELEQTRKTLEDRKILRQR
ncbi:MAG: PDDEXK nuclease domain-containing protein [Deltaproteobacteria bacterium]|nr:PDDEXK nuclease domain-containing protein [Deltaproteobacteria bacterium]